MPKKTFYIRLQCWSRHFILDWRAEEDVLHSTAILKKTFYIRLQCWRRHFTLDCNADEDILHSIACVKKTLYTPGFSPHLTPPNRTHSNTLKTQWLNKQILWMFTYLVCGTKLNLVRECCGVHESETKWTASVLKQDQNKKTRSRECSF